MFQDRLDSSLKNEPMTLLSLDNHIKAWQISMRYSCNLEMDMTNLVMTQAYKQILQELIWDEDWTWIHNLENHLVSCGEAKLRREARVVINRVKKVWCQSKESSDEIDWRLLKTSTKAWWDFRQHYHTNRYDVKYWV